VNNEFIYRLRSCESLLGKFDELEKQSIFLAESTAFNDPLEDFIYLYYKGDKILWQSMFREFVVSLECLLFAAPLFDKCNMSEFYKWTLHSPKTGGHFQAKGYNDRISAILNKFFSYDEVNKWICYLSKREKPLNNVQLMGILSVLSNFAMESILRVYATSTFKELWVGFVEMSEKLLNTATTESNSTLELVKDNPENDEVLNRLWSNSITANMLACYKISPNLKRINYFYFLHDFPKRFVDELKDYVYYRWYAAAFMNKFPTEMDIWGHYANNHTGVCLIFDKNLGFSKLPRQSEFGEVEYNDEIIEVDFFKRMWVLNGNQLKEWYTDRAGTVSNLFDEAFPKDSEREAYWKNIERVKYRKNTDWKRENEVRLTVDDNWFDNSNFADRVTCYSFTSLKGLVFGINTSSSNKARIYDVILAKCKRDKITDFKFYQARYDYSSKQIECDLLSIPLNI